MMTFGSSTLSFTPGIACRRDLPTTHSPSAQIYILSAACAVSTLIGDDDSPGARKKVTPLVRQLNVDVSATTGYTEYLHACNHLVLSPCRPPSALFGGRTHATLCFERSPLRCTFYSRLDAV